MITYLKIYLWLFDVKQKKTAPVSVHLNLSDWISFMKQSHEKPTNKNRIKASSLFPSILNSIYHNAWGLPCVSFCNPRSCRNTLRSPATQATNCDSRRS